MKKSDVDKIAEMTENKNNPVKLSPENLKEILLKRI
jgi:hypothetical protein